jgi:hypothetical protein
MMCASVVSPAVVVDSTSSAPLPLTVPANTEAPGSLSTGTLSPVMGAWLTLLEPAITRPSSGIRSLGFTRNRDPSGTSSGRTAVTSPSFTSETVDGARSIKASTARRARPMLHASSANDNEKRKETVAASNHSPMIIAPSTAIVISRFMSGRRRRAANHAFGATSQPPETIAAAYRTRAAAGTAGARPTPSEPSAAGTPPSTACVGAADRAFDDLVGYGCRSCRDRHLAVQDVEAQTIRATNERPYDILERRDFLGAIHAPNAKDAVRGRSTACHTSRSDAVNNGCRFLMTVKYSVGSTSNVNSVDVTNPPIMTMASGRSTSVP